MTGLSFDDMYLWRKNFKQKIIKVAKDANIKIRIINPVDYYNFENKMHQTELEVMKFDLSRVKDSDLLVVNMHELNTSIGSIIEIFDAYTLGIPVLAFGSDIEYENLHPWIQCCITRHDETYEDTILYIRDFYTL